MRPSSTRSLHPAAGRRALACVVCLAAATLGLTAVSAADAGAAPTIASAVAAVATAPSAPTHVVAVPGDTQATVSWQAPIDDGGEFPSGYVVNLSTDNGATWTSVTFTSSATTQVLTGLTNGKAYVFAIAAVNSSGQGPFSTPSTAITVGNPAGLPGIPTGIAALAANGSATVSWIAPSNSGNSSVSGYLVQYSSDGGTTWQDASGNPYLDTIASVGSLTNGTAYVFRVAAVNSVGTGSWSAVSSAVTPEPGGGPGGDDTSLTMTPSAGSTLYGGSVRLGAVLTDLTAGLPVVGASVDLYARTTHDWTHVGSAATSSSGTATFTVSPHRRTQYEWRYVGTVGEAAAHTDVRDIGVTPVVSMHVTHTLVRRGATVRFSGTVSPSEAGRWVHMQRLVAGRWRQLGKAARIHRQKLPTGHTAVGYVVAVKETAKGSHEYRVSVPGAGGLSAGVSRTLRVTVRG